MGFPYLQIARAQVCIILYQRTYFASPFPLILPSSLSMLTIRSDKKLVDRIEMYKKEEEGEGNSWINLQGGLELSSILPLLRSFLLAYFLSVSNGGGEQGSSARQGGSNEYFACRIDKRPAHSGSLEYLARRSPVWSARSGTNQGDGESGMSIFFIPPARGTDESFSGSFFPLFSVLFFFLKFKGRG